MQTPLPHASTQPTGIFFLLHHQSYQFPYFRQTWVAKRKEKKKSTKLKIKCSPYTQLCIILPTQNIHFIFTATFFYFINVHVINYVLLFKTPSFTLKSLETRFILYFIPRSGKLPVTNCLSFRNEIGCKVTCSRGYSKNKLYFQKDDYGTVVRTEDFSSHYVFTKGITELIG